MVRFQPFPSVFTPRSTHLRPQTQATSEPWPWIAVDAIPSRTPSPWIVADTVPAPQPSSWIVADTAVPEPQPSRWIVADAVAEPNALAVGLCRRRSRDFAPTPSSTSRAPSSSCTSTSAPPLQLQSLPGGSVQGRTRAKLTAARSPATEFQPSGGFTPMPQVLMSHGLMAELPGEGHNLGGHEPLRTMLGPRNYTAVITNTSWM
ncbi:hypothetical protein EJB05_29293, partial [Eragrostis curvula]